MNKPSKCKNCQWYGKPYWSIINPCDNCDREDYYKVMENYYTEDYVKSLLQQIQKLTNNWNELEEYLNHEIEEWQDVSYEFTLAQVQEDRIILSMMKQIKENNNE